MGAKVAPHDILDLIPWVPSLPPPCHEDAFHLHPHIWSELPENVLHSVLAWLPFQSILRFRCVCKQWRALFASPAFHHFASHRAHVPPWIFFFGSCTFLNEDNAKNNAIKHHDNGCDNDDTSDESISVDNDADSHEDHDHGGGHFYDPLMGGDRRIIEHGGIHDVVRYGAHGNIEHGGIHDVMRYGNHGNMTDGTRYGNQDMHDVMRYDDHGDMYDVIRYDDHRDMNDGDYLAILDVDHVDDDSYANDSTAPEEHTNIEPLLLIFDCESASWRSPLSLPPGFRNTQRRSFLARYHACSFQEQLLIPAISPNRLFLFNPASPPFKEVPPCIAIQEMEAFGFVEERVTRPGAVTPSNLSNFFSMMLNEEPLTQDKTAKILQIVAVGNTVNDTNIVERFDSVSGSWHVIGGLPQSDDFIFAQMRLMHCKGCFYGLLPSGIIIMSNVLKGQNMEWSCRDNPLPPTRDCGQDPDLIEQRLVATNGSVFLVGVTSTWWYEQKDCDILIWQLHLDAAADACWELFAHLPTNICEAFIGDNDVATLECSAHGDFIFFSNPGKHHFLIYDLAQKLWRSSATCKYTLDVLAFVWEPLLRN